MVNGTRKLLLCWGLSMVFLPCAKAGETGENVSNYDVIWDSPSHDSTGSMPIGNGDIGLNAWFEKSGDLLVYIAKSDAWNESGCILKLGKLRINFSPNPYDGSFRQELVLKNGEINITTGQKGQTFKARIWVDALRPAAFIEIQSSEPSAVTVKLETWRTQKRELKGAELHMATGLAGGPEPVIIDPDVIADVGNNLTWYHRNSRSVWQQSLKLQGLEKCIENMTDPLLNLTFGCCVTGSNLVRPDKTTLKTDKPLKTTLITITSLCEYAQSEQDWLDSIKNLSASINNTGVRQAYARHVQWWRDFWDRSSIFVHGSNDANVVTRGYVLARWVFACAGRGKFPIRFNGSIFTVDANTSLILPHGEKYDADYRLWGSGYWWQNTRLTYWQMLDGGDFDMMGPLFDMYVRALPLAKARTRIYYNHDGAFFPETQYFWGTYSNGDYGWNRQGLQVGMASNPWIKYYWQSGIELVSMMTDYYAYTQNEEFARSKLIPLSEQVLLFYAQHWKRDKDGKIVFEPAMSLETWHVAKNPLPEIAGLRYVVRRLLELAPAELIKPYRGQWEELVAALPPIPIREENGKRFLLPAETFSSKNNMENPEMYAIFPYRMYGIGKDELELARETFARRQTKASGGWFQDAIQAAYLGKAEEAWRYVIYNSKTQHAAYVGAWGTELAEAIRKYGSTVDPNFRFRGFWGPNYNWIPDMDQPGVTMLALQTMLMQTDGRKILLFPAWPRDLDVEFKLHAPFKTVITGKYKSGKVVDLNVQPAGRKSDIIICLGEKGI